METRILAAQMLRLQRLDRLDSLSRQQLDLRVDPGECFEGVKQHGRAGTQQG